MTAQTYSKGAILFHWSIAILVAANLAIGFFSGALPFMAQHKAIGITVLLLSIGRVGWRLGHRPPPLPRDIPAWQAGLATATHWALYALMLAMPLSGWLMVSGAETRRPLTFFGLFDIPYLPVGQAAGGLGHDAHELLAIPFAALILLHVAGALKHHFIDRDGLLRRMWFRARS